MRWIQPYVPLVSTNADVFDNQRLFPDKPSTEAVYYDDGKWHLGTPEFWAMIEKKYPTIEYSSGFAGIYS